MSEELSRRAETHFCSFILLLATTAIAITCKLLASKIVTMTDPHKINTAGNKQVITTCGRQEFIRHLYVAQMYSNQQLVKCLQNNCNKLIITLN